ncbi:MAG: hypothetical protein Q9198_003351 [Flavoplaca austrocitrina]
MRTLKINELITVSWTGRLRDQLAVKEPVAPSTPNGTQPFPAGDTSKEYKSKIRVARAKLHTNTYAGDVAAKEAMAKNYLVVMADGRTKTSERAFADVAAAVFRNREHSARRSSMTVVPLRRPQIDLFRAALCFEPNKQRFVRKVVSVYDELVIARYVEGNGKYLTHDEYFSYVDSIDVFGECDS